MASRTVIVLLVVASASAGEIIRVPGGFPTIQAAINAAQDGDEVVVSPGVYFENINFVGKDITVRSLDPRDPAIVESTIIDGRSMDSVVIMDRGVISGFTIQNGRVRSPEWLGGGVRFNAAPGEGGEIRYNVVTNCVSNEHGGGVGALGTATVVRNNTITGNLSWAGGGLSVGAAIVVNNIISFNETCCFPFGPHGAGIAAFGSAVIRDNLILDNFSQDLGGGVFAGNDAVVERNMILDNVSWGNGAGVYAEARAVIRNNTVAGNAALVEEGGGIYAKGLAALVGNTVVGNGASFRGGGILAGGPTSVIGNIIAFSTESDGLYVASESTIADYNCVFGNPDGDYGGRKEPGEHDINADPLFVDPVGPDGIPWTEDDNLRLLPESPCINTGDPDYIPAEGETDFDGHARILCDRIDIGAYEFGIGDYDCDRDVDLFDYDAYLDCVTGPDGGPYPDGCEAFDSDADLDIDFADFGAFLLAFTGG